MADEHLSEFMAVTHCDADTAKFYLESSGGDVSQALESFFAQGDTDVAPAPARTESSPPRAAAQQPPRSRVTGLGDVENEDSEDEEEGPEDNEYYAGGEKSGVAVKGGKKADHVENLFESARQHGAVQGTEEDLLAPQTQRAFTGRARTLTGDVASHAPPPAEPHPVTIAFYANGVFTVNGGEARSVNDPRNAEFLDHIRQGMCPPELTSQNNGRPVKVNLIRRGTDYKEPAKPRYVAFSGTGQTLADDAGSSSAPPSQPVAGPAEKRGCIS